MSYISYYQDAYADEPNKSVTLEEVATIIQSTELEKKTNKIRQAIEKNNGKKGDQITALKKKLPMVSFAGKFAKRKSITLIEYSSMLVIDIDDLESIEEAELLKEDVKNMNHVALSFVSPSGLGLKVVHVVKYDESIDPFQFHKLAFETVSRRYRRSGINIDESGKDITRSCFLGYDSNLYLNLDVSPLEFDAKTMLQAKPSSHTHFHEQEMLSSDSVEYVITKGVLGYLNDNKLSITEDYLKWRNVGYGLKSEFGEELGRSLFHDFSKRDRSYNAKEVDEQFDKGMEEYPNGIGIGTIIQYAQRLGYKYPTLDKEHKNSLEVKRAKSKLALADIQIRLNSFNNCREIRYGSKDWRRIEDNDLCEIYINVLHRTYRKADCDDLLTTIAMSNRFDPVKDYLERLEEVNGEQHISKLVETIEPASTKDKEILYIMIRRWLIGLISSLIEDKQANENVLVLIGSQGLGKTQWSKRLLPTDWQEYFATKNLTPGVKDDELMLGQYILILMDELSSVLTKKASNEAFKEMLSMDKISHRKPYAREVSNHVRKASVIGTSNTDEILKDQTGNRRFFPINAKSINYKHNVDMRLVFAEVYQLYKNGERGHLTKTEREKLDKHNLKFEATNPYVEYISKFCRIGNTPNMTCTEIIESINETTVQENGRMRELIPVRYSQQVGMILKSMRFKQTSRTVNGKTKRLYAVNFNAEGFPDSETKPIDSSKQSKPEDMNSITDLMNSMPDSNLEMENKELQKAKKREEDMETKKLERLIQNEEQKHRESQKPNSKNKDQSTSKDQSSSKDNPSND
ncbi:VapE domain-containing protein [Reichenbachiella versicolor]|uniref:VapE domain-containing protein n=1 Tax=Reichenbachiella versicolor TaxID=1821036 RepID=UPI000D6E5002|nr:VapE domain-containing protein [Reichenbachiella versicolor]